jgi:hypothetical protein
MTATARPTIEVPTKAGILARLDRDAYAVEEAILRIYDRQTSDEQNSLVTVHANGVGFSAFDAEFMSSLAQQIRANRYGNPNGRRLSPRQLEIGRKKIKRYAGQLLDVALAKYRRQIGEGAVTRILTREEAGDPYGLGAAAMEAVGRAQDANGLYNAARRDREVAGESAQEPDPMWQRSCELAAREDLDPQIVYDELSAED